MSEYVNFHYMPLEGKITGEQVLKQTEDAINDLGNKVYNLDIDQSEIDEAVEKSNEAINTANSALAAVTTGRSVWFNNVAEMVATDIEAGVTAETKGYYVANDGGNALYLIRQEKSGDVVDGGSLIALDNGNMAELVTDGTVNVKQFGAIGNGTDDDTTVFQNTSSYAQAKGFVPFVGVATYKITGSVTGTFNSFGEVTITGGGSVDIINLQEVVSDVSDIRDEVVDKTASAKAYSESAATSATNAANSASSASTTATQLMAWLDGKEEITDPAVDPTLTISGAAADAKVTGDIFNTFTSVPALTETAGYFNNNGTIASASGTSLEKYTQRIPVYPGQKIICRQKLSSSKYMWGAYCVWDNQGSIIGTRVDIYGATGTEFAGTITMPSKAAEVAFCYRTYGESSSFSARWSYDVTTSVSKSENFDLTNEETLIATHTYTAISNIINAHYLKGVYKFDATSVTPGKAASIVLYDSNTKTVCGGISVKGGASGYFYVSDDALYAFLTLSSYTAGDNDVVSIYKVGEPVWLENVMLADETISGNVEIPNVVQGQYSSAGYIVSGTRICTMPFLTAGRFTVSITDTVNYRFAIILLTNEIDKVVIFDSGWITTGTYDVNVDSHARLAVVISKVNDGIITPDDISNVGLSVTSVSYNEIPATKKELEELKGSIVTQEDIDNANARSDLGVFAGRFKPCYDHLFVNKGTNAVIPHESLYHVRISHALGFNTIEANIATTSDGVFFVNHLNSGKFGNYFHHVDGVTDISNISANSVTWDWIVENVRYNSTIPKYRTRPARLEEFLNECKQNDLIPFATSSDADAVAIIEGIMGKDNYIAYNGTRENCPSAIIYHFYTSYTTKQDILDACESFGKPFIYGLGNPSDFTDSELKDIVETLHKNGYWIGTSYADASWYKFSAIGFDFNGTQQLANRIETGNLHNISSQFGFSGFTYTNATETNGVLTFSANGNISPDVENTTYPVCVADIEIWFNGTISIPSFGEFGGGTYTSDGTRPVFVTSPILNGSPKVTISVNSGTVIYDMYYKSSVC